MKPMLLRKESSAAARNMATKPPALTSNLRIGEPNDAFEREADRVANEIAGADNTRLNWSLSKANIAAPLQRKCACESSGSQGGCEDCRQKALHRKATGTAKDSVAPPIVHEVLRSPGQPLDKQTQAYFEPRFGHDFSKVRVHTDGRAAASAQAVNAMAYAVGNDLIFDTGRYAPHSSSGRQLLGHELAHVIQQSDGAQRSARTVQRQTVAAEKLNPIRADEQGAPTTTSFNFGKFSIFVPVKVSMGTRKEGVDNMKVHIFFSAGAVQGNIGNDILTHGLRGETDWITIGVPSHTTISDQEIIDCLASIGIHSPIMTLRLSAHSRGAFSLMNSIVQKQITTLALIDRVILLDADDNPDPADPAHATKTPKVEVLKNAGISPSKITAYEVNVRKRHIAGATYIPLDSNSVAAIGYVRLVNDAMVTQAGIAGLVAADPAIKAQLDSLPLPPRGSFTTGPPGTGQTSLQSFAATHAKEIKNILNKESTNSGLLRFINDNNLARFSPFRFGRSISAHHFFVAEVAHELTE